MILNSFSPNQSVVWIQSGWSVPLVGCTKILWSQRETPVLSCERQDWLHVKIFFSFQMQVFKLLKKIIWNCEGNSNKKMFVMDTAWQIWRLLCRTLKDSLLRRGAFKVTQNDWDNPLPQNVFYSGYSWNRPKSDSGQAQLIWGELSCTGSRAVQGGWAANCTMNGSSVFWPCYSCHHPGGRGRPEWLSVPLQGSWSQKLLGSLPELRNSLRWWQSNSLGR